MRYQKTNERRAVILMVVLSLLTLFALVGITFVLYADAEAAAARVAREAQTITVAEVNPQEALAYFLGQLIYDVPDTVNGVGSGLRGHSLARTMYGENYVVPPGPSLNVVPFNGPGRVHYGSPLGYPAVGNSNPVANVPANWGGQLDDYALVNYTWFNGDNFVRDPERYGTRTGAQLLGNQQPNQYVGGNVPYTYPDLNNFFLAAMKADGTVLTPSYHRPWLFQVGTVNGAPKFYAFNDMTNLNWYNPQGKYLTLRPRPAEHPFFPLPGDATGDVKNLTWAPGGNDSIWVDLGAPVMTAPDGTLYKMMFAPLIVDLDGRVNLNTAGNALASGSNNSTMPTLPHVSNQGWGGWEVNLGKVLNGDFSIGTVAQGNAVVTGMSSIGFNVGDYVTVICTNPANVLTTTVAQINSTTSITLSVPWNYPTPIGPPAGQAMLIDQEWTHLFTGKSNAGLTVPGRYMANAGIYTPYVAGTPVPYYPTANKLITTLPHYYAQADINGLNEINIAASSGRPLLPGFPANPLTGDPIANPAINPFASFQQGFLNGGVNGLNGAENTNHPALSSPFQSPMNTFIGTRAFRAADMEPLLRPMSYLNGPLDGNSSAVFSDLTRLCPGNLGLLATSMRNRNLVTTQSSDIGSPGVIPYWWNGLTTGYMAPNPNPAYATQSGMNSRQFAPVGSQPAGLTGIGFPMPPPPATNSAITTVPSEYGPDWRALSANTLTYFPTQYKAPVTALPYTSPGGRIRLNRPLPPYPHMGALLAPPYNSTPPTSPSPYGFAYDLTNIAVLNQYTAAQNARQALANDIYRRLLAVAGITAPFNNPANPALISNPPTATQQSDLASLAVRRWYAQLAVNIVDYIDEDDVVTSFNFYTVADGLTGALNTTIGLTQGGDDNLTNNSTNSANQYTTGANPAYWVFGTEMPKVVVNEVLVQAQNPDPAKAINSDTVNIWVELYNTLTSGLSLNTQPLDNARVPLYMNPSASSGGGYSPYIITVAPSCKTVALPPQYLVSQNLMPDQVTYAAAQFSTTAGVLPDDSCNVLGKPSNLGPGPNWTVPPAVYPIPKNTTLQEFANPASVQQANGGAIGANAGSPTVAVGIDPTGSKDTNGNLLSPYFLLGPPTPAKPYDDPFVSVANKGGVPNNTPVYRSPSLSYTPQWSAARTSGTLDERTLGLTVALRRLANPYLPLQIDPSLPNYNPYVTVDYMANVPIHSQQNQGSLSYSSRGKRQPYGGLTLLKTGPVPAADAGDANLQPTNPASTPAGISPVALQLGAGAFPTSINGDTITNTFGLQNAPLPDSGHYDWLVHLDRLPISPMELLHVSAWPPHMLTQRFITNNPAATLQGSDNPAAGPTNALNMFGHYAPWLDAPQPGSAITTMACPWWFDATVQGAINGAGAPYYNPAPSSHRLYRLFEFLECGDRAFGVNGLGRIPGKVNINTVWDAEILQALIDANQSMGLNPSMPNAPLVAAADPVAQIFNNMMSSRSPAYFNTGTYTNAGTFPYPTPIGPVNMGTLSDDRPFMPLSTGLYLPFNVGGVAAGGGLQFPNGLSVTKDTLLRLNATNQLLLFQNNGAAGLPTATPPIPPMPSDNSAVHPYLQTQMLTKLYNNVTTRSNVFAVFLTVGFFQVMPGGAVGNNTNVPQLGPEIGRSEGKQVRHRMFAIVDRTNLSTFTTTTVTPVTGVTPNPANLTALPNLTGAATITLTTAPPATVIAGTQLVIEPGTANEETVVVQAVNGNQITASFTVPHPNPAVTGNQNASYQVIQRGNPGAWLIPYDPRLDSNVVQYFSIID